MFTCLNIQKNILVLSNAAAPLFTLSVSPRFFEAPTLKSPVCSDESQEKSLLHCVRINSTITVLGACLRAVTI